jgi:uncharacterized SAM-binding protein YcdF (DUF218 family)
MKRHSKGQFWIVSLVAVLILGLALLRSGRFLISDQPAWADVILVLDGDSNDVRLQRAVNLLRAGYGKTVLLDERTDQVQFGRTQADAAQEFIARRHLESVEVCPGRMASTAEEVAVVAPCLVSRHAQRVLIVTSAYHTRRALAIFRHRLPQYEWSVAAAPDEAAYGTDWWRRRAWAKTWLGETERFAWWELVDRWRYGPIRIAGYNRPK